MKPLLALSLALTFIYVQSTFTPDWSSCEGPYGWITYNVTLDAAPVAGKNSTFTFCGENRRFYVIAFQKVHVISGTVLDLSIPLNASVDYLQIGCYDVNFEIPEGPKELTLHFSAMAYALGQQGCVDVNLNLENDKKFLGF